MRVIVTGSRDWTDREAIRKVLEALPRDATIVHGGARGADSIAGEIAGELGMTVEVHPAKWDEFGKRAGMVRNAEMAHLGADYCVAFPLYGSRGTQDMMDRCERKGIFVSNFGVGS